MFPTLFARLLFLLLVIVICTPLSAQQGDDCPGPAALMSPEQAAYADAMALKSSLESQGMVVRCIFETKFSSQFIVWENGKPRSTIEGEACISTNLGALEVLFVSRPRTFADLKIKEHRTRGGYLYTVSGMPDVWPSKFKRWGSVRRTYYFRHDNYLLSGGGEELRTAVEAALHYQPLSL
jgi:hypothetical protein